MARFRRLSKQENYKLIELVQPHPALYDIYSDDYLDRIMVANIFDEIASDLKIDDITGNILYFSQFNYNKC